MELEFCVKDEALFKLVELPAGSVIANGTDAPIYFVKDEAGFWHLADEDGTPQSSRHPNQRFDEPIWQGPFASKQIHHFGLRIVR